MISIENLKDYTSTLNKKFILTNKNGFEVHILNYGLTIQKILYPTDTLTKQDIVLGFDTIEEYKKDHPYIGCIVGRNANRLSNGTVIINNKEVQLSQNEGKKQLHGGIEGFNKKIWDCDISKDKETLIATYTSKHLEEGYPGELKITATFKLTNDNELVMSYNATTNRTTVINLTRHDYFNLKDGGKTDIKNHHLKINAKQYTVNDSNNLPTGDILNTTETPLDFLTGAIIEEKLTQYPNQLPMGYDHNFVINKKKDEFTFAAEAIDPISKRGIKIYTTQPGVQLYTAAYLENINGKNKTIYNGYHGLCLETQHFPDATKHKHFESTILNPDNTYTHKLIYKFTA